MMKCSIPPWSIALTDWRTLIASDFPIASPQLTSLNRLRRNPNQCCPWLQHTYTCLQAIGALFDWSMRFRRRLRERLRYFDDDALLGISRASSEARCSIPAHQNTPLRERPHASGRTRRPFPTSSENRSHGGSKWRFAKKSLVMARMRGRVFSRIPRRPQARSSQAADLRKRRRFGSRKLDRKREQPVKIRPDFLGCFHRDKRDLRHSPSSPSRQAPGKGPGTPTTG